MLGFDAGSETRPTIAGPLPLSSLSDVPCRTHRAGVTDPDDPCPTFPAGLTEPGSPTLRTTDAEIRRGLRDSDGRTEFLRHLPIFSVSSAPSAREHPSPLRRSRDLEIRVYEVCVRVRAGNLVVWMPSWSRAEIAERSGHDRPSLRGMRNRAASPPRHLPRRDHPTAQALAASAAASRRRCQSSCPIWNAWLVVQ